MELSQIRKQALKKQFKQLDADHNKWVSKEELYSYLDKKVPPHLRLC